MFYSEDLLLCLQVEVTETKSGEYTFEKRKGLDETEGQSNKKKKYDHVKY
jgi:hypothetical protein